MIHSVFWTIMNANANVMTVAKKSTIIFIFVSFVMNINADEHSKGLACNSDDHIYRFISLPENISSFSFGFSVTFDPSHVHIIFTTDFSEEAYNIEIKKTGTGVNLKCIGCPRETGIPTSTVEDTDGIIIEYNILDMNIVLKKMDGSVITQSVTTTRLEYAWYDVNINVMECKLWFGNQCTSAWLGDRHSEMGLEATCALLPTSCYWDRNFNNCTECTYPVADCTFYQNSESITSFTSPTSDNTNEVISLESTVDVDTNNEVTSRITENTDDITSAAALMGSTVDADTDNEVTSRMMENTDELPITSATASMESTGGVNSNELTFNVISMDSIAEVNTNGVISTRVSMNSTTDVNTNNEVITTNLVQHDANSMISSMPISTQENVALATTMNQDNIEENTISALKPTNLEDNTLESNITVSSESTEMNHTGTAPYQRETGNASWTGMTSNTDEGNDDDSLQKGKVSKENESTVEPGITWNSGVIVMFCLTVSVVTVFIVGCLYAFHGLISKPMKTNKVLPEQIITTASSIKH